MLFHTFTFWTFFAIVAALYSVLKLRGQNVLLLVAGYVFYGWWDWRFLILIALSTVVDYQVGRMISVTEDAVRRRRWLIVSLVFNLALLGVFKYLGFAMAQAGSLARRPAERPVTRVARKRFPCSSRRAAPAVAISSRSPATCVPRTGAASPC